MTTPASKPLGKHLAAIRDDRGFSLREVQIRSKNFVSNAYLSQIETGKIRQPSPNTLHALADVYSTSYEQLMRMAGYISAVNNKEKEVKKISTLASLNLTEAEEMDLVEYLKFRRSQK
ncbi:MAG: hypothetical protein RL141_209 [Candidatus Parcubacteria bacterium]|jgi:transcriptional regulator with XRE-family HTH domain